jgi:hypothetical protein
LKQERNKKRRALLLTFQEQRVGADLKESSRHGNPLRSLRHAAISSSTFSPHQTLSLSLSLDRSIDREVILGNWRRGNPQGTKEEKNKQKTQEGGEHTLTNKGSSRHCNCRLLFKEEKNSENFSA